MGSKSGRDINKADYVTVVDPQTNKTPGILEYPLTIECEVIYSQNQLLQNIDEDVRKRCYPSGSPDDFHTAYIGRIVDAYIIKE